MTFRIRFEVEDKSSVLAEGTAVAIDYINKANPKTEIYTNNHVYHLPKDSFVLIDIEFKRKEIMALSRSSDVKYAKIGQIDGSSIRYEEGDKSFKFVKVYNDTKKQWEEVKEIGDFDRIKEIHVEEVIIGQQSTEQQQQQSTEQQQQQSTEQQQQQSTEQQQQQSTEQQQQQSTEQQQQQSTEQTIDTYERDATNQKQGRKK